MDGFGYKLQTEFTITFPDGSMAECLALEPPEKENKKLPWFETDDIFGATFHLAPEIFISDGSSDSTIGKWVAARNNVGGIHHLAYQVDSVEETMKEWRTKGYAEFTSEEPMIDPNCPGLVQCFTKPSELTGVIYEFIVRGEHGFCQGNVKQLMISTKDFT